MSVSLISDLASLGLLSVLHALRVDDTPDPSVALSDASGFYRRSPLYALAWGAVFLGVACLLALFFATVVEAGWFTRLARWRRLAWLLRRSVSARSAWWEAFSGYPEYRAWVQVELLDGTHLAGYVDSFSPDSDETADRELTLAGPIESRTSGRDDVQELDVNYAIVSARQIQYLTVTFHDPDTSWRAENT